MTTKEAARHRCNDNRANVHSRRDSNIVQHNFERGSLVAGLMLVLLVGLCMIHAAVVL